MQEHAQEHGAVFVLQEQRAHFRGEGGEGGQCAQKTGDDSEPPFRGKLRHGLKEAGRQAYAQGAAHVDHQSAHGKQGTERVEPVAHQPAEKGAQGCTNANCKNGFVHDASFSHQYGFVYGTVICLFV